MASQAEMEPSTGPYVQLAAFCERVLTEQDGVNSLIRIVDRIYPLVQAEEGSPPPTPYNLTAVIGLKSGRARGNHQLTLRPEAPSGLRLPEFSVSVLFEGEDRGINVLIPLAVPTDQEGLFWFDVLVDQQLMTRIPLRVVHRTLSLRSTTPSS
jgi:hypothetical protein